MADALRRPRWLLQCVARGRTMAAATTNSTPRRQTRQPSTPRCTTPGLETCHPRRVGLSRRRPPCQESQRRGLCCKRAPRSARPRSLPSSPQPRQRPSPLCFRRCDRRRHGDRRRCRGAHPWLRGGGGGGSGGSGAGAELAAGRLLRLCAALSALCRCARCDAAEVSESGTCTICHCRVGHDLIDRVVAGLAEASRLRYAPVWRLCSSGHFGTVPELSRLALAYSLRACGSSLRTLHAEVLHRKESLLVLQVRPGSSCHGDESSSSDSDLPSGVGGPSSAATGQQPLQFLGAFLPFAWPWSPAPGTRGGGPGRRGGLGAAAAFAGMAGENCSSALWLFHISISPDGGAFPTVWPLAMGELRPWELMHASVEGGLLIGGTNPGTAALAVSSDLEHGCLALPSSALAGACGDGAHAWPQGGLGSCHMPWDFEVVDVEVWADECSFEEDSLPFEFEYRNQQLNKRITKTVLGGLTHRSLPL
mmetsp:Transcript_139989/g.363844  ORF Transcript_139989/g.363844 Transcript_139989/m.363844 type:complete len:478 (-) Transcript_139989:12-1445(-)